MSFTARLGLAVIIKGRFYVLKSGGLSQSIVSGAIVWSSACRIAVRSGKPDRTALRRSRLFSDRQHPKRVLEAEFHQADAEVCDVDADPDPAQLLRRRDGRSAAAERIENNVAFVRRRQLDCECWRDVMRPKEYSHLLSYIPIRFQQSSSQSPAPLPLVEIWRGDPPILSVLHHPNCWRCPNYHKTHFHVG